MFQEIMAHLNPMIIIEICEAPFDQARNECSLNSSQVVGFEEFVSILIAFVSYVMEKVFGAAPPPEFALDKARKFLDTSIGYENAVFIAISGSEGGIYKIMDEIIRKFKEEQKRNYFYYILDTHINPLSFEQIRDLMQELKDKLSVYSPESFNNYVSAESMVRDYKEIIWSYMDSLSRYRNLWAY